MKYVGIDISKKTFDVCILTEKGKQQSHQFSNDLSGFKKLTKHLDAQSHCLMEATGSYFVRLATYLHSHGIRVSVVNPLVIRRYSQMDLSRSKTDARDAILIARYGQNQRPALWQPKPEQISELLELQSHIESLHKQKSRITNRIEALSQLPKVSKLVLKNEKKLVKIYDKMIQEAFEQMEGITQKYYRDNFERLSSIPGIGKKTAILLIAVTGNFERFDNHKQLAAYFGISPRVFQSGTSVKGRGSICKMGNKTIRKLLYMCALSAKNYNPVCKALYQRFLEKGKAKKIGLIAVANKLLKQAFALIQNKTQFDKNYANSFVF